MPMATRSRTGKLPAKVIQTVEVKSKKQKKTKIQKIKDDDSSTSLEDFKNYSFNSDGGTTSYFSFEYHPLRRKIKNNSVANNPETPENNTLSSPVPFGLKRKNIQDLPGASSINEVNN